jgi:hypothetical protein
VHADAAAGGGEDEGVEAGLLLQAVGARRPGGFLLQGQVHALVAAVLLRVTGLDAFHRDAQPQPPDREFGQAEQAVATGKKHAVVPAECPPSLASAFFGLLLLEFQAEDPTALKSTYSRLALHLRQIYLQPSARCFSMDGEALVAPGH